MAGIAATSLGYTGDLPFGSDAPSAVEVASGDFMADAAKPAYFWAALVGLLIFARWLYENGEEIIP